MCSMDTWFITSALGPSRVSAQVFSIQIPGFSKANSSQLVSGSAPDSRLTLLTVSEGHDMIKYPVTFYKNELLR